MGLPTTVWHQQPADGRKTRRPQAKSLRSTAKSKCRAATSRLAPPRIRGPVIVKEHACMIWPKLFDELPYRSHALLSGRIRAALSVFTHPGLTTTQVIPCGARSMAALGPLHVIEAFLDNVARSDRNSLSTLPAASLSSRQRVRWVDCISDLQGGSEYGDAKSQFAPLASILSCQPWDAIFRMAVVRCCGSRLRCCRWIVYRP